MLQYSRKLSKNILEETMLQFKDKIKKLRKDKDMTQEQLAEYMGVSPQAVSRWETGGSLR